VLRKKKILKNSKVLHFNKTNPYTKHNKENP
jgi:hypothetical protein